MIAKTIRENESMSKAERLEVLRDAKGGTWVEDWRPYCLMCDTMKRMTKMEYGFKCFGCGNMIGWDLTRLRESPLNNKIN